MESNVFEVMSGDARDAQDWNLTFIGGTADLEDSPTSGPEASTANLPRGSSLPLAMASVGDRLWVVEIKGGHRMLRRLTDVGITQGSAIVVVSRTENGSVIVSREGCRIGIGAGMAHRVIVSTVQQTGDRGVSQPQPTQSISEELSMPASLHLGDLGVGQSGRIVGYEKGSRAYREKLLAMGLTPGAPFTLTRQAPMGDPIEIEVRGFKLSLRKGEAAALKVEVIDSEEVRHD